jgi:uncharacterized protein YccT (UPF0319 family)
MSRQFSKICFIVAATVVAGCTAAPVQLHDGKAAGTGEVAFIVLPEELEVSTVNGLEITGASGLFLKGDKTIEVAPGRYEVLAYYRELWVRGDKEDMLRSDPALFTVDAVAGRRYRLEYERPDTFAEAEALAANFEGWVEDTVTGARTPSRESGMQFRRGLVPAATFDSTLVPVAATQSGQQAVPPLPVAAGESAALSTAPVALPQHAVTGSVRPPAVAPEVAPDAVEASVQPPSTDDDWLPLMKSWWSEASPEERREFLRWVGEQR